MCGFYCIAFIEYMIAGENLLHYTNLISLNDYQKNGKIKYKYLRDKYGKQKKKKNPASLDFRIKNIDETRNYLSDEIKHNNLMSKKHKNCRDLNVDT